MKRRPVEAPSSREPKRSAPYEAAIFAAELGADVPTIDLHGDSFEDARYEVGNFLYRNHPPGTEVLRIIHGKGTQILHDKLHTWLKKQKGVIHVRNAEAPGQQGGVTYVVME